MVRKSVLHSPARASTLLDGGCQENDGIRGKFPKKGPEILAITHYLILFFFVFSLTRIGVTCTIYSGSEPLRMLDNNVWELTLLQI